MEQKININDLDNNNIEAEEFDFEKFEKETFVDLSKPPLKPDVLVYYGLDYNGKKVGSMTRGEISVIVAPSKAKKSFNKSLIESAYIGGQTINRTEHITGNRKRDGVIISIDTEQGNYYAWKTFKRTQLISGGKYENYKPYELRKLSPAERVKFTEHILNKYGDRIDMLFIDGIADYVTDENSLVFSKEIGNLLMKWSDKIHINTIIHKNSTSSKATGHLGSVITKKCETVIFIDWLKDENGAVRQKETVKIMCKYSRGISFEDFYMTIDGDGLPFTHENEAYESHIIDDDTSNDIPF